VQALDLFANSITGPIPDVSNITRLMLIDLQENLLTGQAFPDFLFGLSELEGYRISGNALTGEIPTEIGNFRMLQQLWAASCDIEGTIPTEVGRLFNLESLFLNNNNFVNSIPSEIGLTQLQDLRLYGNFLQDEIPSELFNVVSLLSIRLENNFLLGALPSSIGQLTDLKDLRLDFNNLSGQIPSEIRFLSNLGACILSFLVDAMFRLYLLITLFFLLRASTENFLLNKNFWSGTIPDVFQDFESLDYFDISDNFVGGDIPKTLFDIPTLRLAYLNDCLLTGTIPSNYADPPNLRDLYLNDNRITGTIPPVPNGRGGSLNEFLVHNTRLSGSMPESVCFLRDTGILDDLWSDCGGDSPEIECDFPDCCNRCCPCEETEDARRLDRRKVA
jgi:Leucine-rich repeat (LRR) protein